MSIKVSGLAKELGVACEDVLEQLRKLYVDVEDESSNVDDKIAALIRIKLGVSSVAKKPAKPKKEKKKTPEKKTKKTKSEEKAEEDKKETKPKKKRAKKEDKKKDQPKEEEGKEEKEKEAGVKEPKKPSVQTGIIKVKEASAEEKEEAKKEEEEKLKVSEMVEAAPAGMTTEEEDGEKRRQKRPKGRGRKQQKKMPVIEIIEKDSRLKPKYKKTSKTGKGKGQDRGRAVHGAKSIPTRKTPQKAQIQFPITVRELAPRINVKPNAIIQYLMGQGLGVNINQDLEEDMARDIMLNFGYEMEMPETIESLEQALVEENVQEELRIEKDTEETNVVSRAPVVTFMGHVDHGKTSLLDYIRKTMVTKGEKGGITQHIGAYRVETNKGAVTFLDTPGHAAFTAMRARGAHATDVVVLVVAADDGVMPQTKEAIDHAKAANVPIVVAINKCDLSGADPDRVKTELQKENLMTEDWGGDTIMIEVSAITGEGVDKLVEMLMLESEMLELKSNPKIRARGVVIESKKTPGQGIVVTVLVQNGTLRAGDVILCGAYYGKVKAMNNDKGQKIKEAPPSTPVEILGLQGVPEAGEEFYIVKDEKKARTLALLKQDQSRNKSMAKSQGVTLEDFHNRLVEGSIKELKIILKGDVQGSVEALKQSLEELSTDEVKLDIIHLAVGDINESDAILAMVSNAIVIGFHVKVTQQADAISKSEKVDIRQYDIIYEAIADVRAGMEGLLEPEEKEVFQGSAQIREVFPSKTGKAAGCAVTKGTIHRKDRVRVKRGSEVVFEGEISALKRFKDDAKEVREGFECGISLKGFNNINKNDVIEAFIIEKIARRLEK